MKFNNTEWEIIQHRLDVADAIAECLTDVHPDDEPLTSATYSDIFDRASLINQVGVPENMSELDLLIIKDCCTGSTFFADMGDAVATGEITKGAALNYYKAAKSLEEKLKVVVPLA